MTATTIFDYYDVLAEHEFTPDDDGRTFCSPGHQARVTVTDDEGVSVTVAALTADRARLIRWEVHLHGAPITVLEATIRAAELSLATTSEGE